MKTMALLPYARRLFATKCYGQRNLLLVRNLMSKELTYSQFGDPLSVVKFRENQVPELGSQEVLVRMLAAPVNPADINTIQGKYPVKISLPSIPGNENSLPKLLKCVTSGTGFIKLQVTILQA